MILPFCYVLFTLQVILRFACCEALIGVEEIFCGFIHINSDGVLILEAEIHIEDAEVIIRDLYADKELLRLYPTSGCGTAVVVAGCILRSDFVGVALLGEDSEFIFTDAESDSFLSL